MPRKEQRLQTITHSKSYFWAKKLKTWLDDYYLDGVVSLIPIVGDILTQLFNFVFVYISVFKIRSARLTIVILFYSLLDIMIGLIPYVGAVFDFFYKSFDKNLTLIDKFVQQDIPTIKRVNTLTFWALIGIFILLIVIFVLIYWVWWLVDYLYVKFSSIYQ